VEGSGWGAGGRGGRECGDGVEVGVVVSERGEGMVKTKREEWTSARVGCASEKGEGIGEGWVRGKESVEVRREEGRRVGDAAAREGVRRQKKVGGGLLGAWSVGECGGWRKKR